MHEFLLTPGGGGPKRQRAGNKRKPVKSVRSKSSVIDPRKRTQRRRELRAFRPAARLQSSGRSSGRGLSEFAEQGRTSKSARNMRIHEDKVRGIASGERGYLRGQARHGKRRSTKHLLSLNKDPRWRELGASMSEESSYLFGDGIVSSMFATIDVGGTGGAKSIIAGLKDALIESEARVREAQKPGKKAIKKAKKGGVRARLLKTSEDVQDLMPETIHNPGKPATLHKNAEFASWHDWFPDEKPYQEFYAPPINLRSYNPGHLEFDGRKRGGKGKKMMTPGFYHFAKKIWGGIDTTGQPGPFPHPDMGDKFPESKKTQRGKKPARAVRQLHRDRAHMAPFKGERKIPGVASGNQPLLVTHTRVGGASDTLGEKADAESVGRRMASARPGRPFGPDKKTRRGGMVGLQNRQRINLGNTTREHHDREGHATGTVMEGLKPIGTTHDPKPNEVESTAGGLFAPDVGMRGPARAQRTKGAPSPPYWKRQSEFAEEPPKKFTPRNLRIVKAQAVHPGDRIGHTEAVRKQSGPKKMPLLHEFSNFYRGFHEFARKKKATPGHVVRKKKGPARKKKLSKSQQKRKQAESARRGGGSARSASSNLGLNALTQMARSGDIDWSKVQLSGHRKPKVKRLPRKRRMATKKTQQTQSERIKEMHEFSVWDTIGKGIQKFAPKAGKFLKRAGGKALDVLTSGPPKVSTKTEIQNPLGAARVTQRARTDPKRSPSSLRRSRFHRP